MSSSASFPPGNAPIKLLPPIGDFAFVDNRGHLTMAGFQMLQRIYSYLGQPGSATGGTATGETVTEGIAAAQALAAAALMRDDFVPAPAPPLPFFGFPPSMQAQATGVEGEIWAPLVNGDPPGDTLVGFPSGQIKGPTLVALPNGACIMVRIQ